MWKLILRLLRNLPLLAITSDNYDEASFAFICLYVNFVNMYMYSNIYTYAQKTRAHTMSMFNCAAKNF